MRERAAAWGALAIAVLCMLSVAAALRAAMGRDADPVATLDAEFRALAVELPARGVIGYLDPAVDPGSVESLRMRHVAQYALAPRVVVFQVGPEFLIVARGAEQAGGDPRLEGFYPVATFRSGHRIFRRLRP